MAKVENQIAVLEGHDGTVTAAEFCPHYSATLVSISEDRTFKVRVFDLTEENGFRCFYQLEVSKVIDKERDAKILARNDIKKGGPVTISSRPTWKKDRNTSTVVDTPEYEEDSVETGASALALYYTHEAQSQPPRPTSAVPRNLSFLREKSSIVRDFMVGTTAGFLQIKAQTMETCSFVDFQEPIHCLSSIDNDRPVLNAVKSIIFGQGANNKIWCIVGSPFQNVVHLLQWC